MKWILPLIFILITGALKSAQSIEQLRTRVTQYVYANKFDSAQVLVFNYLERKNLTQEENFYAHFLYCDVLKSSGKNKEAIECLEGCRSYCDKMRSKKLYLALIEGNIAECYFSEMDYANAKKHALASINISADSSLRGSGHAVNYIMLGYADYMAKNYGQALAWYNQAIATYQRHNNTCELPLCYTKIARLYNSMHNEALAEENIRKAIAISDSCGIENYKLLSKRTLFEIYKENKNYEKALAQLEEINVLVAKLEDAKQGSRMTELEVKYKTLLAGEENQNLKKAIKTQTRLLYFIISASVILCVLVFFLIRVSLQRKKGKLALETLNAGLEQSVRERTNELAKDNAMRKKLERQLNEKIHEMETLISKLTHDVRAPLTSVMGLINIAQMEHTTDKEIYFEKIKDAVKRLDNIVIDLSSIMYVTTMQEKAEVIDFNALLNETKANLAFTDNFDFIQFNITIKQTRDFHSDKRFLHSIFQNLLENAVKYSNRWESVVAVTISEDEKGIKIEVADNGTGISPEFHDKIFDMFYRATNLSKGSGLGLYIVKRAVEKLQGKIEVKSEKRVGTTMTVYLPDLHEKKKVSETAVMVDAI